MIYSPAEDSFLLESEVIKKAKGKKVLDMGCGSGVQSLAALKSGAKSIFATDINEEAVKECRKKGINSIKSNLLQKVKGKFDLIIFNPPYLPEDKREDAESSKATSGGKKGDEIILKFLKQAKKHLEKNGEILLLLSSLTPKERINKLLNQLSLNKKVLSEKKIFMEKLEVWLVH